MRAGTSVSIFGLTGRTELNGQTGVVVKLVEAKQRYAVKLETETVLVKEANLKPVEAASATPASSAETRRRKREKLAKRAAELHALKEEATTHSTAVYQAKSRADLADSVWDRVVEIQQQCQKLTNACSAGFPELQAAAIEADDAQCWSDTSAQYAHFLLGQPGWEGQKLEAQSLAARLLKMHACTAQPCRAAQLARAVQQADGPFSLAACEPLLVHSPPVCVAIDGNAWAKTRGNRQLTAELQSVWDDETAARLARKGADMAAEASAIVSAAEMLEPVFRTSPATDLRVLVLTDGDNNTGANPRQALAAVNEIGAVVDAIIVGDARTT